MTRVFIVEDEHMLRFFYTQILEENGFEVAGTAKNGEEAVSMFKEFREKPSVILMDHRMPVKNGIDCFKEILTIDDKIIVVFVSADSSIKKEELSLGVHSFKQKPFSIDYLISNIKSALDSSKSVVIP